MTDVRAHVLGVARREGPGGSAGSRGAAVGSDSARAAGAFAPDESLLVTELTDPATGETFYRPPGGGIEFGESSEAAVVREFHEELGLAVDPVGYLGTVENRFEFGGTRGHELAVVHEVAFRDDAVADRAVLHGVDDGGAVSYEATWEPLDDLVAADRPLYPEGIERILRGETTHVVD